MRNSSLIWWVGVALVTACSQKTAEESMFNPQKVDSSVPTHIQEITRALEQSNPQPEWYVKRARLFLAQEKPEPALKDLTTATVLDPALGEAYFWKAKIHVDRYQYQDAMKMMMQAKAFNFYTPESEAILAETYVGLKQYKRALTHGSKAIKLNPGEAKYYVLMAQAQTGTGDTTRALNNLQRALVRDSVSLPAYRELSAIYTARGIYEAAYPMVHHGVRKQPKNAFWRHLFGPSTPGKMPTPTAYVQLISNLIPVP